MPPIPQSFLRLPKLNRRAVLARSFHPYTEIPSSKYSFSHVVLHAMLELIMGLDSSQACRRLHLRVVRLASTNQLSSSMTTSGRPPPPATLLNGVLPKLGALLRYVNATALRSNYSLNALVRSQRRMRWRSTISRRLTWKAFRSGLKSSFSSCLLFIQTRS